MEDNNNEITEQRLLEMSADFMEQFGAKDRELDECKEKLALACKGVAVGYSTLRTLDNYVEQMDLEGPLLLIKKLIELTRADISDILEELVDANQNEP